MYFYKYQKAEKLEIMLLKRGEVFFASQDELNDRHECRPKYIFNGSKEVWARLTHYILVQICIRYNLYPTPEEAQKLISLHQKITKKVYAHTKRKNVELSAMEKIFHESLKDSFTQDFSPPEIKFILNCATKYINSQLRTVLHQEKYICSFTKTATNPTMWGHYGDAERGFLIIYQTIENHVEVNSTTQNLCGHRTKDNSVFIELGLYTKEKLKLEKVQYRKSPPKVNAFSRLIHRFHYTDIEDRYDVPESLYGEIKPMEEDIIALTKYTDWKYEKEVRLIFPTYHTLNNSFRCLQIQSAHIKGIIFGSKISNKSKDSIVMACIHLKATTMMEHDFAFFQIQESDQSYKMKIVPIGLLENDYIHHMRARPINPFKTLGKDQQSFLLSMGKEIEESS
jgi:hypothetical protein